MSAVCAIVSQAGPEVRTRCGRTISVNIKKGERIPDVATGWESLVTCEDCIMIIEDFHADDET